MSLDAWRKGAIKLFIIIIIIIIIVIILACDGFHKISVAAVVDYRVSTSTQD